MLKAKLKKKWKASFGFLNMFGKPIKKIEMSKLLKYIYNRFTDKNSKCDENMFKTSLKYPYTIPKTLLKHPQNISKTSLNIFLNIPHKYFQNIRKTYLKHT